MGGDDPALFGSLRERDAVRGMTRDDIHVCVEFDVPAASWGEFRRRLEILADRVSRITWETEEG